MNSMLQRVVTVPFSGTLLLSLAVSLVSVSPLLADEFTNITDIKGCRAIEGEAERLLCYDTVSDGGIFNEEQLKQVQVEQFGSDKMPKAPDPAPAAAASTSSTTTATTPSPATRSAPKTSVSVDRLNVTIIRSKKDNSGFYYFQTSEGQVWKQLNATGWSASVPFEAEIKKGVLGTFFLVNEGGKSTRVKRVR
jgi:hypothetical protein